MSKRKLLLTGCEVASYDWQCLHHEGYIIPQVQEVSGHVRVAHRMPTLSLIVVPSAGFFSRLKEKGAMAKEVWGVVGSA